MHRVPLIPLFLLLSAVVLPEEGTAQSSLTGSVRSIADEPVAQAMVELQRDGAVLRTATADGNGRFVLAGIEPGRYVLVVGAGGYADAVLAVEVGHDARLRVAVRLRDSVLELAPLTVVGGPRTSIADVPGSTYVVGRSALERHRPAGAHELLRHGTGVHVQEEDPLGVNLNIGVRGLTARRSARVLLLEDGVPILLGPYGDPTAHYQPPPEALRRIEVVKGSGQIAQGPQTVGGVINFVRVTPPERRGGVISVSAGDHGRLTGHLQAGGGFGAHAAMLTLDRRETDGARNGWHHKVSDAQAQLLLRLANGQALLLRFGGYTERSNFGETGLTQQEFERAPFENPTPHDTFELTRIAAHALYTNEIGSAAFSTVAYAQDIDRTSWRQASSSSDRFGSARYAERFGCGEGADGIEDCGFQGRPRRYRFAGVEPRLRAPLATGLSLDFGARAHFESAHRRQYLSPQRGTPGGERARDNELLTTALSAFLQPAIARGAWRVTPGVRLEHVRSGNSNRITAMEERRSYTQLLPGVGASFSGVPATTLFAGAHRGFAPPRPADVLEPGTGQSIVQVDPEVSWNFEIGARTRARGAVEIDATFFRIEFDNQVVEGSLAGAGQRFVNAGSTLHQGFELAARLTPVSRPITPIAEAALTLLPDARFTSAQLSAADGETPVRGNRLPYAPRTLLSGALGFGTGGGFEIVADAQHVSRQYSDDLNTRAPSADGQSGELPAYTVFGVAAAQRIATRDARVFARIYNLTDRLYIADRLEGIIVGTPRRIAAGVEWRF